MKKVFIAAMLISGIFLYGISEAVPTKLVVKAKSKDAKFVGTKMGGALVTIKDSNTGKVLAKGLTAGSTGNTGKIMIQPKTRFGTISDGAAKFETSIDINEPTLITIDVDAPLVTKPDMIRSSTQMWLIPGKDITGEGIIIEIPGFSVVARAPEKISMTDNKAVIPFQSQIVMI
jgi:hypothetical protein